MAGARRTGASGRWSARRSLGGLSAVVAVMAALAPVAHAGAATLTIDPAHPDGRLPASYTGLSLEANVLDQQWTGPARGDFLALLRNLRPASLRIGGGSVDASAWLPSAGAPRPSWAGSVITEADLSRLGRLARAARWRVDLGVNLAHPNPVAAGSEARAAVSAIGWPLRSIEVGNEPDAYIYEPPNRPYLYPTYEADEERYRAAISAAAPTVRLAGPDTATKPLNVEAGDLYMRDWLFPHWLEPYARDHRTQAPFIDQHLYPLTACLGAAGDATIDELLSPGLAAKTRSVVDAMVAVGRRYQLPVHIDESNNVSCGGEPGVSNTFASALWVVNFLLLTAKEGVAQVNLHGSGGVGCDGYTPACFANAAARTHGLLTAQPEYYGALLVSEVQGGTFIPATLSDTSHNLVAYALRRGRKLLLVLLDLDPKFASRVSVRPPHGACRAVAQRLTASSLRATSGVRFSGAAVTPTGHFHPASLKRLAIRHGRLNIALPAASAELVTIPLSPRRRDCSLTEVGGRGASFSR